MSERREQASDPGVLRSASRLIVALCLVASACSNGDAPPAEPTPSELKLPPIDFEAIAAERETREAAQGQLQRGYQCGWRAGWMQTVRAARNDAPSDFRSSAVGRAFGWGAILLVIGLAGTMLLAWFLPRLRRRAQARATAGASPTGSTGEKPPTKAWVEYFKGLVLRFFARVGRTLRVEQFDPTLAGERQRMIESCRDSERQLAVATAVIAQVGKTTGEGASAPATLTEGIATWKGELTSLRRRLEGPAPLPPELAHDRVGPPLQVAVRAARDLRLAAERALIASTPGETVWPTLERELADRPATPRDSATSPETALAPWVRTVGYAGLAGLALALVMLACWMAAGAFPLFFALLFGLAGLGAVLFARMHLHRAGRLPLLPGFSDRIASWLTGVLALTLLATMVSSWMSTESGLDLGDPPPVAMPDPRALEAPKLFPGSPSSTSAPTPAPALAPP